MRWLLVLCVFSISVCGNIHFFKEGWNHYDAKYSSFPEWKRVQMLDEAKAMFHFGYDNYMKYAFPKDELDPIHCSGRGPDYDNPSVPIIILLCRRPSYVTAVKFLPYAYWHLSSSL